MTQPISGTGPIGSGLGLTSAQAITDMVAFRAYGFDLHFVPAAFTLPGLVSYRLVTTPVLEAGIYSVTVGVNVSGSAQGTQIGSEIEFDGVGLGVVLTSASVVGGGFVLAVTAPQMWGPGPHTIEYFLSHPASPGSVTGNAAITTWVREA